ncbi:MAG TPA: RNA-directed DNA polymerase [Actinomycetota bacterium]|nr:RNA-directed DNA polymerase [Actinomycetota bacterium]
MRRARTLRSIEPVHPGHVRFDTIAKRDGGRRVIVHLGAHDRLRYAAAVAAVTPEIERFLSDGVVANRARVMHGRLELEPWTPARRRYRGALRAASRGPSRAAFVGDVRDCYGSIGPASVSSALHRVGARRERIEDLAEMLRSFEARGVRGLPVGPDPSAVLANAVLAPVDSAVREVVGFEAIRWVDDIVVFTRDVAEARRTAAAFHRAVRALGLEAHDSKCRVIDEPDAVIGTGSAISAARGVT